MLRTPCLSLLLATGAVLLASNSRAQIFEKTDLGALPGFPHSDAFGINALGQVAGKSVQSEAVYREVPVVWYPTAAFGLDAGIHDLGAYYGTANVLNDDGQATGTACLTAFDPTRLFVWLPQAAYGLNPGIHRIPAPSGVPTDHTSYGLRINSSGQIVGYAWSYSTNRYTPILWEPGAVDGEAKPWTILPLPAGVTHGRAKAINEAGQVAGTGVDDSWRTYGFTWDPYNGALPLDPTYTVESDVEDINNIGQVVGQLDCASIYETHPFVWDRIHGLVDLDNVLGLGYVLSSATDINNKGQVAGWGLRSDGYYRIFVWDPVAGIKEYGSFSQQGGFIDYPKINDAGMFVASFVIDNHSLLLYGNSKTGEMVDMGTLGGSIAYLRAINEAGQAAGSSLLSGDSEQHAMRVATAWWNLTTAGSVVANPGRRTPIDFEIEPPLDHDSALSLHSESARLRVPASIVVPSGTSKVRFYAKTPVAVRESRQVTISASLEGTTKTAVLVLEPPPVTSIVVSPDIVPGGSIRPTATVTLPEPVPADGQTFPRRLIDVGTGLDVPADQAKVIGLKTQAAGVTSFSLTIWVAPVSVDRRIKLRMSGVDSNVLTIRPPKVQTVTLSSYNVLGGSSVTSTITLDAVAPVGGILVYTDLVLSSDPPGGSKPSNGGLIIPEGMRRASKTWTMPLYGVPMYGFVHAGIRDPYDWVKSPPLTVRPIGYRIVVAGGGAPPGGSTVLTIALFRPAPAGGLDYTLECDAFGTTSVHIDGGASSASVTVNVSASVASGSYTGTCRFCDVPKSFPFTVY